MTAQVHAPTRQHLLDIGRLLDVSRLTREHRIKVPTAITTAAWTACGGTRTSFATPAGDRLAHQILAAARAQARSTTADKLRDPTLGFSIEDTRGRIVELELTVGPDDDRSPVATIDVVAY